MAGTGEEKDRYQRTLLEFGECYFGRPDAEEEEHRQFLRENNAGINWLTNRWIQGYEPVRQVRAVSPYVYDPESDDDVILRALHEEKQATTEARSKADLMLSKITVLEDECGLENLDSSDVMLDLSESNQSLRSLNLDDYEVESNASGLTDIEYVQDREMECRTEKIAAERRQKEALFRALDFVERPDFDEEYEAYMEEDLINVEDESSEDDAVQDESFVYETEVETGSSAPIPLEPSYSKVDMSRKRRSIESTASLERHHGAGVSKKSRDQLKTITRKIEDCYELKLLEKKTLCGGAFHIYKANVIIRPDVEDSVLDNSELYGLVLCDIARKSGLCDMPVKIGFRLNTYGQSSGANEFSLRMVKPSELSPSMCNRQLEDRMQSSNDSRPSYNGRFHLTITAHQVLAGSGKMTTVKDVINREVIMHGSKKTGTNGKVKVDKNFVMANHAQTHCLGVAVHQGMRYKEWSRINDDPNSTNEQKKAATADLRAAQRMGQTKRPNTKEWTAALKLLADAGIHKPAGFTIEEDLPKLQNSLPQYRIIVVLQGHRSRPIFVGDLSPSIQNVPDNRVEMALLLSKNHYSFIRKLPSFFNCRYYCVDCNVKYNCLSSHYRCSQKCVMCLQTDCPTQADNFDRLQFKKTCVECEKVFVDKQCYKAHRQRGVHGGRSRCESVIQCHRCSVRYYDTLPHVCGERYCNRCQGTREPDHTCTLSISKAPKKESDCKRLFYDIETEAVETDGDTRHVPVNVFSILTCRHCYGDLPDLVTKGVLPHCDICSPDRDRVREFERYSPGNEDSDVMKLFLEYAFESGFEDLTMIAHNFRGFDGQFVLQQLDNSDFTKPELLIMNGRKIMGMKANGIRMLDSLSYIQAPLRTFPKTFGFEHLAQKGDFPYGFIKRENFGYVGKMPPFSSFCAGRLVAAEKKKLKEWYDEKVAEDYVWSFQEEIHKYTMLDTVILAMAMMQFEQQILLDTKVTLFEETWTAASAAMKAFRRGHLKPRTMALDPNPRHSGINQSAIAIRYLSYLSKKWNVPIKHKFSGGEFKIPGTKYHVDGYIEPSESYPDGLAIDIKGCYWHACPCKYEPSQVIRDGQTAQDIRDKDARREKKIREYMPLNVITEHEIRAEIMADPEVAEAVNRAYTPGPIDLRTALFGGRTECIRMRADADFMTILQYLDVTSLYPYIMKYRRFMVGPSRYVHPDDIPVPIRSPEQLQIEGVLCVDIEAPMGYEGGDKGFLPVLPVRKDSKLLFPLCSKCNNEEDCSHVGDERLLHGTYTHEELLIALQEGYIIKKVYGALHWDKWVEYSSTSKGIEHGLFSSYVDLFLRLKQEASGYPEGVVTEEEKDQYIAGYYAQEGILLDKKNICLNKNKRAIAKMFLNSLWGKFSERYGRPSHHYVENIDDLNALLVDKTREIKEVFEMSENRCIVIMDSLPGYEAPKDTSCLPYSVFTTSYARCYLYSFLKRIPRDDLVYMDTDSVIFEHRPGQNPLEHCINPFLGGLTSEIEDPGSRILSFRTVGPKSYSYVTEDHAGNRKTVTKVKGFRKTGDFESKVTFDLLDRQIQQKLRGDEPEKVVVDYDVIIRDKTHHVLNKEEKKVFGFTFSKRRILSDGSTRPIGWQM